MKGLSTLFHFFQYSCINQWPRLLAYIFLKTLRYPARFTLKLRDHQWTVLTTKPSGLHFFNEVVIHETYSPIKSDLQTLKEPLIIDGGANCGAFALWALSLNPQARIISFEPGMAFENLAINQRLYSPTDDAHWRVEKCALSSENGSGYFTESPDSSMSHLSATGSDLVPIRKIDSLGLSPQVLKIDVEGHELEVLKGSEQTLSAVLIILLEYHSTVLRSQCMVFLSEHHFTIEEHGYLLIGRRLPKE